MGELIWTTVKGFIVVVGVSVIAFGAFFLITMASAGIYYLLDIKLASQWPEWFHVGLSIILSLAGWSLGLYLLYLVGVAV